MATPTLDGHANASIAAATSGTVTLTTSSVNDVIIVLVANGGSTGTRQAVESVASANLTFIRRGQAYARFSLAIEGLEVWWAPSAAALSSEVITVTLNDTDSAAIVAFGVSGAADINAPFDPDASLPAIVAFGNNAGTPMSPPVFSTTNADDFIFAVSASTGSTTDNENSPWTSIDSSNPGMFLTSYYHGVTATQSSASPNYATANNNTIALRYVDAITGNSGGVSSGLGAGAGTVALRGHSSGYINNVSSWTVTLPGSCVAGDSCIVLVEQAWPLVGPAGWEVLDYHGTGPCNGAVFYRILTAGDIATGSFTFTATGAFGGGWACAVTQGPVAVDCALFTNDASGSTSRTVTTGAGPQVGSYALYFAAGRGNTTLTSSAGTSLENVQNTDACLRLAGESLVSSGAVSSTFAYGSAPSGDYYGALVLRDPTVVPPTVGVGAGWIPRIIGPF